MRLARCAMALLIFTLPKAIAQNDGSTSPQADPLIDVLSAELEYSMSRLVADDGTKPYYIAYTVYDDASAQVSASLGALAGRQQDRRRSLNIDLRVGDYTLDNTHQLRESGPSHVRGSGNIPIALTNDADAIRQTLWYHTDQEFKDAARRLAQIKTNLVVKVEEEDKSDDFTKEPPSVHVSEGASLAFDTDAWAQRVRRISAIARNHPLIYSSSVSATGQAVTRTMVTNEGTRLKTPSSRYRVVVQAATVAEDGMYLTQSFDFNAADSSDLPDDGEIEAALLQTIEQVLALRKAPIVEPYTGPAILLNRASGVFFHEIFGHRIEGHRQKDVLEGQTFAKKIGEAVLPKFISVIDDPTAAREGEVDLRGHYLYDDEGVRASKVTLVDEGILKTFLLSRSPVEGFTRSNGHGRRQPGAACVSRQGNLIVRSAKTVSFEELRAKLIEECERQGKPYGLLFEDISGGFTTTGRQGPQSFKVEPLVVYRVYADGRADELVRGVDIVGTPLSSFEKIICTGDDYGVFNGSCGAESGWVPVSAVSPSILVSAIEIEKRARAQTRPPLLDPPRSAAPDGGNATDGRDATTDGDASTHPYRDRQGAAPTDQYPDREGAAGPEGGSR